MSVSSVRPNAASAFAPVQPLAPPPPKEATEAVRQKLGQSEGLSQFQDGFDAGPNRAAQMDQLLQSTVSALVQTVQSLTQLLSAQIADLGGAGADASAGAGGLDGFDGAASGEPVRCGAEAPASDEPVRCGTEAPASGAEGEGALCDKPAQAPTESASGDTATAAPTEAPAGESTAGVSSGATPSGDAKLGAGFPSALGQFKGAIESAAATAGVPASMLAGQIWQESRGNIAAVTTNGGNGLTDTGLMQVNPNTFGELQAKHPELQGKNLADPETNILAGAFYMKDMKEQFGSWDLALRAYNSGPNGVDKSNPNAIPAGTGDATYVTKVKAFWDTISTGNGTLPA
ncbi:lytic transglycosylase domain-containing protein [Hyalangium versicolor]|uniref:lytic transglycosylase domain-containing protein n=1 Tax=Hyalangium versicolor TaxID=2861190 RepID=UPI001CCA371E|nr:transglycosylase SLT domain-containing protein [Hyalangium versicolor]